MEQAELEHIVSTVRDFVRSDVVPREVEIDTKNVIPDAIREKAKRMGLFGFTIPQEYGGLGLSSAEECELVFELGYTTPALRSMFGTNNGIAGHVLMEGGTDEQKKEWLPLLASGEVVASFALTEPGAGSDPGGLTTSARQVGDTWLISGSKRYITNAPTADAFMVFARTDPDARGGRGITAFLVPRDSDGLSVATPDHKMGQFGALTADVNFDEVVVPGEALIGGEAGLGRGYATAMRCLAHGRIHIAALCVGMSQRLVDESVDYARNRTQGGRPIAVHQLVQGMVADSITETMAARSLVLDVARRFDNGTDRRTGPAAAKYFCSETVGRVADRAVQIHGGAGYMRDVAVERFYRDARLFRIYEGSSQIQQVIIAREALGDAAVAR